MGVGSGKGVNANRHPSRSLREKPIHGTHGSQEGQPPPHGTPSYSPLPTPDFRPIQTLNVVASFRFTATFFSLTYCGNPSLNGGGDSPLISGAR